jgi:hypothetical protein
LACNASWSFRTLGGGNRLIANLPALMPLRTLTLNSGPFAPPALPGFNARTGLSATPGGPACPSRVSGWESRAPTSWGFPCCVRSPLPTCRRHYPGGIAGFGRFSGCDPQFPSDGGLPRFCGGSAPTLSVSRPAQRSHTLRPISSRGRRTTLSIEGSDGFVTSTAAPIATGWNDQSCRAGVAPAEDRHLSTAHTEEWNKKL